MAGSTLLFDESGDLPDYVLTPEPKTQAPPTRPGEILATATQRAADRTREALSGQAIAGQQAAQDFSQQANQAGFLQTQLPKLTGDLLNDTLSVSGFMLDSAINDAQVLAKRAPQIANAFNQQFTTSLFQLAEGPMQLAISGLEKAGLVDPGTTDAWSKEAEDVRRLTAQRLRREFGDDVLTRAAKIGGDVSAAVAGAAPFALVGPQGPVTSVAGRIGQGALGAGTGALAGAAEFVGEGESRSNNILISTIFGTAGSATVEFADAARRRFNRLFGDLAKTRAAGLAGGEPLSPTQIREINRNEFLGSVATRSRDRTISEGLELQQRTGVQLGLPQIDPSTRAQMIEGLARNDPGINDKLNALYDAQPEQFRSFVEGVIDDLPGATGPRLGQRVHNAFKSLMGTAGAPNRPGSGLFGKRASEARRDFDAVQRATGGRRVLSLAGFTDELHAIIDELSRPTRQSPAAQSERAQLLRYARALVERDIFIGGPGGIVQRGQQVLTDGQGLQDLLQDFGRAQAGKGAMFPDMDTAAARRYSKRLFGALNDDMDKLANARIPGAPELRAARDNYRTNSERIEAVRDSTIGKMFGGTNVKTPGQVESAFMKMDPATISETLDMLNSADPQLRGALQRHWLKESLQQAQALGPPTTFATTADETQTIAGKFLDVKKGPNAARFDAVFPDGKVRNQVTDALSVAMRIVSENNRTGGQTRSRLKDLAGVIASRDKTFISRLGADMLTPKFLAEIATGDAHVLQAFRSLLQPFDRVAWSSALYTISNHFLDRGWTNPDGSEEPAVPPETADQSTASFVRG